MAGPQYIPYVPNRAGFKNLAGHRFGLLVALEPVRKVGKSGVYWRCKCDCGGTSVIKAAQLNNGRSASCGCRRERPEKLTGENIREWLHYDQNTGVFTWVARASQRAHAGSVAGYLNSSGYIMIETGGRAYCAHRLAFLYMNGAFPNDVVDHIDGNRSNNCWRNLRPVTAAENIQNQRRAKKDNKLGLLGVVYRPDCGLYRARIQTNGKRINVGYFTTLEAASAAYLEAKRRLHSTCTI